MIAKYPADTPVGVAKNLDRFVITIAVEPAWDMSQFGEVVISVFIAGKINGWPQTTT